MDVSQSSAIFPVNYTSDSEGGSIIGKKENGNMSINISCKFEFSTDHFQKKSSNFDNNNNSYESRYLNEFEHIGLIGKGGFGYVFEGKLYNNSC